MSESRKTAGTPGSPLRGGARTAGVFWLLTILTGFIALILGGRFVVSSDAAAAAGSFAEQQSWLRLSVATNIIATACYLAATVMVFRLFEPVSRDLSLLAASFSVVGCAIGALGLVFQLGPLVVLGRPPGSGGFTPEQSHALAILLVRWGRHAGTLNFAFFGLHVLLIGWLIVRSTFVPRLVGALMVLGGLGWLTFSFTNLLVPTVARTLSPFIMVPGILGESALTFWLLLRAATTERLREQAMVSGSFLRDR